MASGKIRGVTFELYADTEGLIKSINNAKSSIKGVQTQLKDVNKVLKLDPSSTTLLTQKQELLKKQVDETDSALQEQKKALQELQDSADSDKTIEAQNALQREIAETEAKLKDAEKELQNFGSVGAQQVAVVGEKVKEVGEGIASVGDTLTKNVTAPLLAVATASVKVGMDFDASMSQVAATMGMTADEMNEVGGEFEQLREFAQEMGATTAFSATQASEALNFMALAGYSAEESMKMLPTVLNLASAGGMELALASDMVTDSQSALGLSMEETAVMVDQMAKTSSVTNTSVQQLGEAFLKIGGTAQMLKGGTAELSQVLGILADNGTKGAEGGTHLRNILLSLTAPTDKASAVLYDLGVEVFDAEGNMRSLQDVIQDLGGKLDGLTEEERVDVISNIFNKADIKDVNALLNTSAERWEELAGAIDDSSGSAETMADTQLNNLQGSLTLLKSALEGAAIAISDVIAPAIREFTDWINGLVTKFNELSPETQELIVKIGLVAMAIGPLLATGGRLLIGIGQLMTFAPAIVGGLTTIGGVITGTVLPAIGSVLVAIAPVALVIAGIIAVGVLLWKHWDEISAFAIKTWETIKEKVTTAVTNLKNKVVTTWTNIKNTVTTTINNLKTSITTTWNNIKNAVQTTVENLKTSIVTKWNNLKTTVTTTITNLKTSITTVWTNIQTAVSNTVTNIKTKVSSVFTSLKTSVSKVWNGIKTAITSPIESAKTLVSNAISKIKGMFPLSIGKIFSNLKLPHINISGGKAPFGIGGMGTKPSISVDWYKRASEAGAIFNREALFGFQNGKFLGAGDASQPEMLLGKNTLLNMISGAVSAGMNSDAIYNAVLQGTSNAKVSVYIDGKDVTGIVNKHNTSQQLNRLRMQGA